MWASSKSQYQDNIFLPNIYDQMSTKQEMCSSEPFKSVSACDFKTFFSFLTLYPSCSRLIHKKKKKKNMWMCVHWFIHSLCGNRSVGVLHCPPNTKLGGCCVKRHQQLCHHSHQLLVVGDWGFVGYWFSPSRDGFHNWLKWPGAERDGSLLKTISQPCLERSQAQGCSDAFQPQPDWQQLGVSEPSSACAPHKHP